jgi:hypothetical protein
VIEHPPKIGYTSGLPDLTARPPYGGQAATLPVKKLPANPHTAALLRHDGTMNRTEVKLRKTRPIFQTGWTDGVSLCCINSRFANLPIYIYIY